MGARKINWFAFGFMAAFLFFIVGVFSYSTYTVWEKHQADKVNQQPNETRIADLERRLVELGGRVTKGAIDDDK